MPTRRERLEAKRLKRLEWAESAAQRATRAANAAHQLADQIPMGQPVLVGHHSERRHRRDIDRIQSGILRSVEEANKAKEHRLAAAGLDHALQHNIFSDDADALERLAERIAAMEADHAHMKVVNSLYRRKDAAGLAALGISLESLQARLANELPWCRVPYPGYALSNSSANIRRLKDRIKDIEQRNERAAHAEANGGITVELVGAYATVTFDQKPPRQMIAALKAAGYRWGRGSWVGNASALPDGLPAGVRADG